MRETKAPAGALKTRIGRFGCVFDAEKLKVAVLGAEKLKVAVLGAEKAPAGTGAHTPYF